MRKTQSKYEIAPRARKLGIAIVCGLVASLFIPSSYAFANDDQSYAKMRDWISNFQADEVIPSGTRLTEKDRTILEKFIPPSAWEYYIFDGMEMEIAEAGNYPTPTGWGQNTSRDYTLDQNGVLVGFKGGAFPFEEIKKDDPFAGQKVVWNMLWRPGSDDYDMPMVAWLRGEHGRLDRQYEFTAVNAQYARGETSLVPGYEEVKRKQIMEFRSPRDMAGAKDMSISYVDHYKEDSGWLYMPAQRKPRRTLASERTSEMMGMDFIREDMMGFGGKVYENDWTYLGTRPVFATINVPDNPEIGGPHLWVPHKTRWELRNSHVVMTTPKAENHPYSQRIIFIDAETYWTHWMFGFDRKDGQMLRMNQHFLKYSESYGTEEPQQAPYIKQDYGRSVGHQVFLHVGETDINAKKPHATISHCFTNKREFTSARARQFFSLRNMVSGRR